jgi:hypothetical protein
MTRIAPCLVSVLLLSTAAQAQLVDISSDPEAKRRHDALFAQVLQRPGDADLSRRYAAVAIERGDWEAAIGALERIVFSRPDDHQAQADIGILYFRLGAYEPAREALEVATAPAAPADVRARAAGYLVEIERRLQPTQWSFSAQAGLRYQSNANAAPTGTIVRALGFDTTLPATSTRKADWNAFALGSLQVVHDLQTQRGDTIEAGVSAYYARQFRLKSLNAGVVEANLGPRLALAPDLLPGWSVRPYATLAGIGLGDAPYMGAAGGGVTLAIPLGGVLLEPGYDIRRRRFRDTSDAPTNSDGRLHTGSLLVSGRLSPALSWYARATITRTSARTEERSSWSRGLDLGFRYVFDAPLIARRLTVSPFAGVAYTSYDGADPVVDPDRRRKDREWRAGATLEAPLAGNLGFSTTVQFVSNRSTLPNYKSRNMSVTFGPTLRF